MSRAGVWRPARPTARAWSETARSGEWPETVFVSPMRRARRRPRVASAAGWALSKAIGAALWLAAGLSLVAAAVAAGWLAAYVLPRALNAVAVWFLSCAGVAL